MKKIAILGLGLMGGSLGMAVKKHRMAKIVAGYARRVEVRRRALERAAVDEAWETPQGAVQGADFVVFCLPVLTIPEVMRVCRRKFADKALITDVGSTKSELVAEASVILNGTTAHFVGSHPIAGSEMSGIDAARSDLYEGSLCVVTEPRMPSKGKTNLKEYVTRVTEFWQTLGMRTVQMTPQQHDQMVARTSHLPHLIAALLVNTIFRDNDKRTREFCGTGMRDTTRIAGGSEDIWHDIVRTNSLYVGQELQIFGRTLERMAALTKSGDFEEVKKLLAQSRKRRLDLDAPCRERGGG